MSAVLEEIAERAMIAILEGSDVLTVTPSEMRELENSFMMQANVSLIQPPFPNASDIELHIGPHGGPESDYDRALRKVCTENGWSLPWGARLTVVVVP